MLPFFFYYSISLKKKFSLANTTDTTNAKGTTLRISEIETTTAATTITTVSTLLKAVKNKINNADLH